METKTSQDELIAALYKRISTDEDLQKWSLGGQEKELKKFANLRNYRIYKIYEDSITGSSSRRPGLDRLRDDMAAGKFDVILVVDQDRLSRMETIDWELLKKEMREAGVRLVTPVQEIDFTDEDDELVSDVFNLFARHQRRKLKKAMKRGRAEAAENGSWFGKPPYGRKKVKNNKGRDTVIVDPETGPIVQKMFQLYLEGYGSRTVAGELNKIGIPSPEGSIWDTCSVLRVITHPIHRGDLRRCENGRDIYVEAAFEPTVPIELFDRCQKILRKRSEERAWQRNNTVTSLAAGSLLCGECHTKFQVAPINSRYGNKKYSYYYYRHRARNKYGQTIKPSCKAVHRADQVDARLIGAIKLIGSSPLVAQKLIKVKNSDKEKSLLKARLDTLSKAEKQLSAKKEKLLSIYLDGDWDKSTLKKKKKAIEAEIQNVKNQHRDIAGQLAQLGDHKLDMEYIFNCFAVLSTIEKEMSRQQQRKLIQALFPKIEIYANGDMRIFAIIPVYGIMDNAEDKFYVQYVAQGIRRAGQKGDPEGLCLLVRGVCQGALRQLPG